MVMPRVLVINPNTTAAMTDLVVGACAAAQPQLRWEGVTAAFGAPYIASEATYAVAAHAVLDAFDTHFSAHDAVLIACFGDPGLLALREVAEVPVYGLAQASFEAAAGRGRFSVVTGGTAWGPMLRRFARMHQLDGQLCGIHTVDLTGAQIAANPQQAMDVLCAACNQGVGVGARHIIIGGAALSGLAAELQPRIAVPLLDNVVLAAAAVAAALSLSA